MDIFEAIWKNNLTKIKELLDLGVDVNLKNIDGKSPLHIVCMENKIEIAKLLLEHPKIDINAKDNKGDTPLHYLCSSNITFNITFNLSLFLKFLFHPKINVNAQNEDGETPLHVAFGSASADICKLLLDHPKIDVNSKNKKNQSILHQTLKFSRIKILNYPIIKNNIDINSKDIYGRTPLFYNLDDNYSILEVLVNNPLINVNIKNNQGESCLYLLCKSKDYIDHENYEKINLLLSRSEIIIDFKTDKFRPEIRKKFKIKYSKSIMNILDSIEE